MKPELKNDPEQPRHAAESPVLLEVRNIRKTYGEVLAVDNVSFSVGEGSCFGLLGPNGAGKTTTVEILEGIRKPTAGEIIYKGRPMNPRFKAEMGIQFQSTSFPEHLTVREVLVLFGSFYPKTVPMDDLVAVCSLSDFIDRDTRKLSGGQRQRVLLATALVNDPEILFLDEPTTGLDPQARRNFWNIVNALKKKGKTILLTTHYMEEAHHLCDEIIIMDKGLIIAQGPPKRLLKKHFSGVSISLPLEGIGGILDDLPWPVLRTDGKLQIRTPDVRATLDYLLEKGVGLSNLEIHPQTLEDLFLDLTGRDLRT